MKEVTFGAVNNPLCWYGPEIGMIQFASNEDAKRAEALFTEMSAEILQLSSVRAEGFASVPVEPTQAMLDAARMHTSEPKERTPRSSAYGAT